MFSILNICLHSVIFTHDHMTAQLAEPSHVQWKLVYQYSIFHITYSIKYTRYMKYVIAQYRVYMFCDFVTVFIF